jgi:hypothetical protein
MIDPMPQPFCFTLKLVTLTSQRVALAFGLFGPLAPLRVGRSAVRVVWRSRFRHAAVMPEFTAWYKT